MRREASGLVAALLQWHIERGLKSLPLVDRGAAGVRHTTGAADLAEAAEAAGVVRAARATDAVQLIGPS